MRYLFVLLLAGCATTESVWVKPGSTNEQFYADRGQCQAQGFGAMAGPASMQAVMIFTACMQGKGWHTEERPKQ